MRLNKRQNGRLSDDKVAGNYCGHPCLSGKTVYYSTTVVFIPFRIQRNY
jgi:hypothetical protein